MTATLRGAPPRVEVPPPRPASRSPGPAGGAANLGLAALTLAAVLGLSRLFTRPSGFFFPVAAVALTVHLAAWACRRERLELALSAVAATLGGGIVACWVTLGRTTAYGIPWRGTYHALGPALQAASDAYRATAAPTHVIPGFVIAGAFGAGIAAFLADWAAFRMRAGTEACLPSFSLFVLSAALAQGHQVGLAAGAWLGAVLLFFLLRQPAIDGPATAWFASSARRGPGSIIAIGASVCAVTVLAVVTLGPHLPGATRHPLFNWRRSSSGGPGRSTGSPLVDITARLHDESQQEVFTVETASPGYWRITALDKFDGKDWSLSDEYRRSGSSLPGDATSVPDVYPSRPVTARFQVSNLQSLWLPAEYRPTRVEGVRNLNYSADAASIITDRATSDGLTYTVTSAVPTVTLAELRQSPYVSPDDPAFAKYLELPDTTSREVRQLALEHTAGAATPYDAARMLQDWLRSPAFRYSLSVPADDSPNALLNFLTRTRAGFCQQFATAFAVLARAVDLPARVAVGFTEGQLESDGVYHVRDDDAHAWPEVYFPGAGWVAFEPTPSRGSPDPGARLVTGAPPSQAETATSPTSPATTAPAGPGSTVAPSRTKPGSREVQGSSGAGAHRKRSSAVVRFLFGTAPRAAGFLAGLLVLWMLLIAGVTAGLAAFRRRRAGSPEARVLLAWAEAGEALADTGAPSRPWETPAEYARRAARALALPPVAGEALARLGGSLEVAAYAPTAPDDAAAATATADLATIRSSLSEDARWWEHIVRVVDPRPVVRATRAAWRERVGSSA